MTADIFASRISRVIEALAAADTDAMIVTPSTDFAYLTGVEPPIRERLLALGIGADGTVRAIVPAFEVDAIGPVIDAGIELITWSDGEDAAAMLLDALQLPARPRIAVGAGTPMRFPLEFMQHREVTWSAGDDILVPLRMRKSASELAQLKAAALADDETYRAFLASTEFRGRTELEVQGDLRSHLAATGHDLAGSFSIVAAGPMPPFPTTIPVRPSWKTAWACSPTSADPSRAIAPI